MLGDNLKDKTLQSYLMV